jgi:hypothetical protein
MGVIDSSIRMITHRLSIENVLEEAQAPQDVYEIFIKLD